MPLFSVRWVEIVVLAAGVFGLLFRLEHFYFWCKGKNRSKRGRSIEERPHVRNVTTHSKSKNALALGFTRKPKQTAEGWQFPVKASCLLLSWTGLAAGIGAVVVAGMHLLALRTAGWIGWAAFALGFALVLLTLAKWPEPLILDREGLLKRGSSPSRIRWQELSHVRHYQVRRLLRRDRGVVIHSIYGKQLVVAERTYSFAPVFDSVLESLLDRYPVPIHSLEDAAAPIPIFKAQIPKPE